MIEKVNPGHPDKIADRIAGALVDLAYKKENTPKIAVEVLIGHGKCTLIIESSCRFTDEEIKEIVERVSECKDIYIDCLQVNQDPYLASNQEGKLRCGDNGIFKGVPLNVEETTLSRIARGIYKTFPYDGKYILDGDTLTVCQSNATEEQLDAYLYLVEKRKVINPLGEWVGGINVDSGATNRKLGSDMARAITGGGIHGKDLSKADVSVNIYCWLKAQKENREVSLSCAIGDEYVDGRPYEEVVRIAKEYVDSIGGFEKMAEWGLF